MMLKNYFFEIAGLKLCLRTFQDVVVEDAFQEFLCEMPHDETEKHDYLDADEVETEKFDYLDADEVETEKHDYLDAADVEIVFLEVEQLSDVEGMDLVTEANTRFSEFLMDGQYVRRFHRMDGTQPYALLRQVRERKWVCECLVNHRFVFSSMQSCFAHIAFERILFENQAMILHSSFIKVVFDGEEQGILFTGVSGIGKSTQAELWEKYEQASILNGDRTILKKMGDCWYGYGSPYAGSSKIYRNEGIPIRAIVALQQAEEDSCVQLRIREAFSRVYAGLTVNTWNHAFVEQLVEWNTDLCIQIPVFLLQCTPQQSAVTVLKKCLERL